MSAGRKTFPVAQIDKPAINEALTEAAIDAMPEAANQAAAFDETLALGRLVGQMETATFYETISLSVRLDAFNKAKESKGYKNLTNPKTRNHFANLEEFCQVYLGCSLRRMEQISNNRELIGKELFEQSESLGLRQKDYAALKALPADDQALVKKAIEETTSREEVIDLIEEMAVKHAKEKEALNKGLADARATAEARSRVLADKETTITKLQEELAGREKVSVEFLAQERLDAIDAEVRTIAIQIASSLRSQFVQLGAPELGVGDVIRKQVIGAAIGRIIAVTRQQAADFDIAVSGPESVDAESPWDEIWAMTLRDFDAKQAAKGAPSADDGDAIEA